MVGAVQRTHPPLPHNRRSACWPLATLRFSWSSIAKGRKSGLKSCVRHTPPPTLSGTNTHTHQHKIQDSHRGTCSKHTTHTNLAAVAAQWWYAGPEAASPGTPTGRPVCKAGSRPACRWRSGHAPVCKHMPVCLKEG